MLFPTPKKLANVDVTQASNHNAFISPKVLSSDKTCKKSSGVSAAKYISFPECGWTKLQTREPINTQEGGDFWLFANHVNPTTSASHKVYSAYSTNHIPSPHRPKNRAATGCHVPPTPMRRGIPLTPVFVHADRASPALPLDASLFHVPLSGDSSSKQPPLLLPLLRTPRHPGPRVSDVARARGSDTSA